MTERSDSRADLSLLVDGGSLGNPGRGYGSFRLADREGHEEIVRLEFGDQVTNNQAEYRTLIAALEAALAHALEHGWSPERLSLAIVTDSQLMAEQMSGRWRVRQPHLKPLYQRARALLQRFGRVEISWRPRREIVAVLGH
ncbi:reverse transcriptase-like protein [Thermomicrobiaceae bacterium CFH 74404]|uniref:Reverse transcriptase-like protein n=3 Tax=Thermomicrobia TaxID=189775 RepID=A0AA41WAE2_9BACT|nr:reverse transcriptase-like protein [Thermalbibacter longus]MCM8749134.1 reverse transcriptase-like protein [Thermalbibacter longus]